MGLRSNSASPPPAASSSSSSNAGGIAGGVVGGIAALVLIGLGVAAYYGKLSCGRSMAASIPTSKANMVMRDPTKAPLEELTQVQVGASV